MFARTLRPVARFQMPGGGRVPARMVSGSAAPAGGGEDAPVYTPNDYYVRDGGSPTGNGSDWANARDDLPATLARNTTYWIADGSYSGYTFNTAASGTDIIQLRKATAAYHGPASDWNSAYGEGEALFSVSNGAVFTFSSSHFIIDGAVGTGKNPGGFGIRLYSSESKANVQLCAVGSWPSGGADNITIKHVEFDCDNGTSVSGSSAPSSLNGFGGVDYLILQHCYFHHGPAFALYIGNFTGQPESEGILIEHCYFYSHGGGGGVSAHWELFWATDWNNAVIRYNTFDSIYGGTDAQTGWLMFGSCNNIKIYGNLFCGTSTTAVGNNGIIATWSSDTWTNNGIHVINNTFVDITGGGGASFRFTHNSGADSNVVFKNNLYYLTAATFYDIATQTHEAFGGGVSSSGTSAQTGVASSIFTNYSGDVFTLASGTTAGDSTVGAEYASDAAGATRGADGTWDRGYMEYAP